MAQQELSLELSRWLSKELIRHRQFEHKFQPVLCAVCVPMRTKFPFLAFTKTARPGKFPFDKEVYYGTTDVVRPNRFPVTLLPTEQRVCASAGSV